MHNKRGRAVSRRTLIIGVASGVGMLGLSTGSAFAADANTSAEPELRSSEEFLRAMPSAGVTDLEGIHAEYVEAVAAFPFPLPPGFAFPAKSGLENIAPSFMPNDVPVVWRRGNGYAEVFMYWQSAMATAVLNAHSRDDEEEVSRILDSLENGYNSAVRRAVLEDPDNAFIKNHLAPARGGDFSELESFRLA